MSELGTFIRRRREELGLTQRDIANRLGCSNGQVSSWEQGAMRPRKHVVQLAEILEVSAEELSEMMVKKGKGDLDYWKKNGNGNGDRADFDENLDDLFGLPNQKATLRPMTIPQRVQKSSTGGQRLLIAKHQILDEVHSTQAILDVGLLVGDENTVKVLKMIAERLEKIEATAKGLVE